MSVKGILTTRQGAPVADATIAVLAANQPINDIASISGPDGSFSLSGIHYPAEVQLQISTRNETYTCEVSIDAEGNLLVVI